MVPCEIIGCWPTVPPWEIWLNHFSMLWRFLISEVLSYCIFIFSWNIRVYSCCFEIYCSKRFILFRKHTQNIYYFITIKILSLNWGGRLQGWGWQNNVVCCLNQVIHTFLHCVISNYKIVDTFIHLLMILYFCQNIPSIAE